MTPMPSLGPRISRRRWDLERFGLTPAKLIGRAHAAKGPGVVALSLPKAGTHLVERMICLHPSYHRRMVGTIVTADALVDNAARLRSGELLCAHVRFSRATADALAEAKIRSILCLRDPRDVLVSRAHFMQDRDDHYLHALAIAYPNRRELIEVLIEGEPRAGLDPLRTILLGYVGWIEDAAVTVRFEELTDQATAPDSIANCFAALEMPSSDGLVERISGQLFSSVSPTFRKGQSGEWEEVFDADLLDRFEAAVGDLMPRLGYLRSAADE
jgi:hypothetical protein